MKKMNKHIKKLLLTHKRKEQSLIFCFINI